MTVLFTFLDATRLARTNLNAVVYLLHRVHINQRMLEVMTSQFESFTDGHIATTEQFVTHPVS